MAIKKQLFQIKGMQRDLSKSKFNPNFAYTIYNMRIMPTDTSTLYSLINEKGTLEVTPYKQNPDDTPGADPYIALGNIQGNFVGQAIINDSFILFTTTSTSEIVGTDYIYQFWLEDYDVDDIKFSVRGEEIFSGNLNFSVEHPLETLASYETEDIQKIYWVDGVNCPRVINVARSVSLTKPWSGNNTYFDFQPTLTFGETVSITRNSSGGNFPGGTIQYCFTYSRVNGQESKIFYITPIYYITNDDRALAPDEISNSSYNINLGGTLDTSFDFINVYSIIRTSYNSTPIVKLVTKIDTNSVIDDEEEYTPLYTDTNTSGISVDPQELYYKGGEYFIAGTLETKDNTLFLADITIPYIEQTIKPELTPITTASRTQMYGFLSGTINSYQNQLTSTTTPITYLKKGNKYRLGYQLQDTRGNWSSPVYISDYEPEESPAIAYDSQADEYYITIPTVTVEVTGQQKANWYAAGYRTIRPLVVYPLPSERGVIAQGVVSPTLFTPADRINNNPYAQPSWFFRPYNDYNGYEGRSIFSSVGSLERRINRVLHNSSEYNGECQYMEADSIVDSYATTLHGEDLYTKFGNDKDFYVDDSILTFNSPDLYNLSEEDLNNAKCRIVGFFFVDSYAGDIHLNASIGNYSTEPNLQDVADKTWAGNTSKFIFNFSASTPWKDTKPGGGGQVFFAVFPWQRQGSLNEQNNSTAILSQSRLSNLRHSQVFKYTDTPLWTSELNDVEKTSGIGKIKLCLQENEGYYNLDLQTNKYTIPYTNLIYTNHVNQLISRQNTKGLPYASTIGGELTHRSTSTSFVTPIKYFSSTHAVIELLNRANDGMQYTFPIPFIKPLNESPSRLAEYPVDAQDGPEYPFYLRPDTAIPSFEFKPIQPTISIADLITGLPDVTYLPKKEIMWIVELYRDIPDSIFGGNTEYALQQNQWIPAGEAVLLDDDNTTNIQVNYTEGDTIFNRWDCFKTLPYTEEDLNGVVEVMSFMCESYKNIAGRYDQFKGLTDYYFVNRGTSINVYNNVYDNKDNLFSYRIPLKSQQKTRKFPNYIAWSLPKNAGNETDTWTQMTLADILELDGNKGKVTALERLDNDLIAFQEQGISQVLYNESVQIQSTTGVPIEIANSGKVQGKRYIDNIVGCSNKWSIAIGADGIYFIDDITKGIYLLGKNGIVEISDELGFHSFINTISTSTEPWYSGTGTSACRAFYDKINGDVFFIWDDMSVCLCYSEAIKQFMSFFSYKSPGFVNVADKSYWIARSNDYNASQYLKLWEHNAGEFNQFYDEYVPYGLTVIANQNPTEDKIFNTVEFRADSWLDKEITDDENTIIVPELQQTTFDYLVTENEYQRGIANLTTKGCRIGNKLYTNVTVLPYSQLSGSYSTSANKTLYQAAKDDSDPEHSEHYYMYLGDGELLVHPTDVTSQVLSVSVNNPSSLKRKFRIWRALVPRNNISRTFNRASARVSRDRMRNTWLTVHLYKSGYPVLEEDYNDTIPTIVCADRGSHKEKTVLHDIVVSYT